MTDTPFDSTHPSLLVRLRDAQDAEAWRLFVATYAPLVYGACRREHLQDADAADVAQDVMVQVARTMRTFEYDRGRGRFRDWLWTVTRHRITRFQAKMNQERAVRTSEGADALLMCTMTPDPEWIAEFNAQVLRVALERVRPLFEAATWHAFERTWSQDQPPLEVAAELGLPIEGIYAARSRVLKRLREEILLLAEDVPEFVPLR